MTIYAIIDEQERVTSLVWEEGEPPPNSVATNLPTPYYPSKPFEGAVLRVQNGDLVWQDARDLETVRAHKNQQINAWRAEADRGTFVFMDKQIQVDDLSRMAINAVSSEVALTGELPASFSKAWKALDNSYISIPDVLTWKQFVKAMVAQSTANFLKAQELKNLLQSYTTLAEIDALTWETL